MSLSLSQILPDVMSDSESLVDVSSLIERYILKIL